ncbi:MAG: glycosyltransferase family 2 protein [Nitrospirae bacterium]|nr:glycosyltransferase family 2 protein [Nitrospirota bacterium]NTW65984.1 glycosyltransferase family 2 protein [Nitrospirota bacterium]
MNKILIIIPAYNEEESLPGVMQDLRSHAPDADILVVDDGSRDRTAAVARQAGVKVASLPYNLGIGGAMQTGFQYARNNGYDIAIQFDGDGQHMAAEINELLDLLKRGRADIVVGSRFLDRGEYRPPFFRKIGIWVFSTVLSAIIGIPVTDTTSGFRAANRRVIEFFARSYPEDYPEVESLVLLHRARMTIAEVPVRMRDRTGGRSSITPIRSAYYMVKVLLAVFVDLMKK